MTFCFNMAISMVYRHLQRTYLPDSIYFVTTNVRERNPFFNDHNLATMLEETIWYSRRIHRCVLYAYVIMPDHLHLLMQPTRTNISQIMHAIKINSSRDIHKYLYSRGIDIAMLKQNPTFLVHWNRGQNKNYN